MTLSSGRRTLVVVGVLLTLLLATTDTTLAQCTPPYDQGTWTPNCVTGLDFTYNGSDDCGDWVQMGEWFWWDHTQLQNLRNYDAHFQFEIARPSDEYMDYWHCYPCGEGYWTNLPESSTDSWTEEEDPPWCHPTKGGDEEFEIKNYGTQSIQSYTWYGVYGLFTWDDEDRDTWFDLQTEGEVCGTAPFCNYGKLFYYARFWVGQVCFGSC